MSHRLQIKYMSHQIYNLLNNAYFTHSYQINARTELAIRYNDISPLENHHCAVAFQILSDPLCNIFANISEEAFREIRSVGLLLLLRLIATKYNLIKNNFFLIF